MPKTKLGQWSVGLQTFFLAAIIISIFLVKILQVLNFDNHWWDVTVAIAFPSSIIALIIGIIAVIKYHERSVWVKISIFVGVLTVLFIILHSLFIND